MVRTGDRPPCFQPIDISGVRRIVPVDRAIEAPGGRCRSLDLHEWRATQVFASAREKSRVSGGETIRVQRTSRALSIADMSARSPAAWHQAAIAQGLLYWTFRIPSARILDSRVDAGTPSFAAAPEGPATLPRVSVSAASIISRS